MSTDDIRSGGDTLDVTDLPLSQVLSKISHDPSAPMMENFFLEIIALVARGQCEVPNILGEKLEAAGIEITGGKVKGVRESLKEWWGVVHTTSPSSYSNVLHKL